jgi:Cytochrome c554 and c-prime
MRQFVAWAAAAVALAAAPVSSAGRGTFVGAANCKLCHRDVYQSWAKTPHARAIDRVPSGPGLGEDARARCLTCHATSGADVPSVQCEACHGPGSGYSAPEVMIDPEKAAMAGLVRPSIGSCERCHDNDEPSHKGKLEMPLSSEWGRFIHDVAARE